MKIVTKTITNDLEYLRQVSEDVDLNDPNLKEYIKTLKEYFSVKSPLAMAAVQLGIPKRLIYIRNTSLDDLENKGKDEARVLINPKIVRMTGRTRYWEACASCLDNCGLVLRPYRINLEYFDILGNKHSEVFEGFESTVLSHEMDHLEGILI